MSTSIPLIRVAFLVRDSRSTKGASRDLLMALALRCNPKKNYCCWPSYRQLAFDTCLHEVTLKKAAAELEEANLIKRVVRRNRSNMFFINVPLLQEQAEKVKKADADGSITTDAEANNPFSIPDVDDGGGEVETESDEDSRWGGLK